MSKIQINAVVMLGLVSLWFAGVRSVAPYESPVKIAEDFSAVPAKIPGWDAKRSTVKQRVDGLDTACSLDRVYANSQGDLVVLTIVYAAAMSDLHQPEGCLGGQGWSTGDQHVTWLRPEGESPFEVMVNRMEHESNGEAQATLYWFGSKTGNSRLLSTHKLKVYFASIRGRSTRSSALIRIIAPARGDADRAETLAKDLAEAVAPHISTLLSRTPKYKEL